MKVLQINCVYKTGSTGKITYDIHAGLKAQGIDSVVCYGRGNRIGEENVYKICGELYSKVNNLFSRFTGLMYGGCSLSTKRLINLIRKEKPDVVHLHCLNGNFVNIYRLISWLKDNKVKTVLTLHAEFMYTGNCGHALDCENWKSGCGCCPRLRRETKSFLIDGTAQSWRRMKRAFSGFDSLVVAAVSPWLADRAAQSPIMKENNIRVVFNGLNTDIFHYWDASDLRKKMGLSNQKIVFHATPFFSSDPEHIKGGYYVLRLAERLKDKNVKIIVAGDYDRNIQAPDNLTFVGKVSDPRSLAEYYSIADVCLLASRKETFSMVTAESLCCGTPVVGFEAGGPEQIAIGDYSEFVPAGDIDGLCASVNEYLEKKTNPIEVSRAAMKRYSSWEMCNSYLQIYKKMMEDLSSTTM